MAGNPGPLNGSARHCWPVIAAAGLLLATGGTLTAGEQRTGDVLTAEHPGRLVVFNKYQQRLSSAEELLLLPFVPMVLIRERDLLGDGFTPCASVEIDRERFYLLRDETGGLSSSGDPGKTEVLRDVTLFGDTVVLLGGRALEVRPAGAKEEIHMKPGSRVVREFEHAASMYVRLAGGRFGWITPSRSAHLPEWRVEEPAASEGASPGEIIARLQGAVDAGNASLRRVYAVLSEESGRARTPPSFRLARSGQGVRCLIEPPAVAGSFAGSLRAILPDFERILGGTGLHAELADGAILIPLR
jgi:hypothetical protein